jgi:hypothetical protein
MLEIGENASITKKRRIWLPNDTIALNTRRQVRRLDVPAPVFVIRRRDDRQMRADRLDPVLASMPSKNAINTSRGVSSAFTRSSCLSRSRSASAALRLGTAWASARWTHERSVSACWNSHTALSRTSAEYFFAGLPTAPSISCDGASWKHGAVHAISC